MYYYNLTLKQASAISHAVVGQFSGSREDYKKGFFELAVAKGKYLEILRPNELTGKLQSLISVNLFGIIRSIAAFRLTGGFKDYIAIGADSGKIVILEYLPERNRFDKIHQETFGRSGIRRIVPGQYLACDSKGRAVMIGAVEKQKLVYQLNRDTQANLTISSPLEAHKANTFVFHMINVDVGFENPLFACLELDYEAADEDQVGGNVAEGTKQHLTYYELDLGLNHVVRKFSEPLDEYANMLISVPGGNDGPSGLIVCSESFITYKNFGDQPDVRCPIPRRKGETDVKGRGVLIACSATYKYLDGEQHKFFFFLQTELGDVFKTEFELDEEIVSEIRMTYFDTLPVASALCLLPHSRRRVEGGLMFVAAEAGDHLVYQIEPAAASDEQQQQQQTFSSKTYAQRCAMQQDGDNKLFQFKPSTDEVRNLVLVDTVHSMAPILAASTMNRLDEHQLVVACGAAKHSSVRLLRHGLEVEEQAMSVLPSVATGVWSIKKRYDSPCDDYIVVSFTNATLVLGVGDTIDEIVDSGLLGTKATIGCTQLGDDSLVQVHPDGIRHIHANKRVSEWRTPLKRQIMRCALNQRQVAIALSNNEVLYFEMDTAGQLNEYNERKEFPERITCMALGDIADGELRSPFLAVGFGQKVCVISLDLSDCMNEITRQTFQSSPESICIAEMGGSRAHLAAHASTANSGASAARLELAQTGHTQLYLNVGLQSGELVRTRLDRVSGDLSEPIRRFLGNKPVRLYNVRVHNKQAVLACTNKSWLLYCHQNKCHLSPLSFESIDHASSFVSPQVPEGMVAISGSMLRVLSLERLGDVYNQTTHKLAASPRRLAIALADTNSIVVLQCSRLPLLTNQQQDEEEYVTDRWHSLVQLMDARTGCVLREFVYESNEAAMSVAVAKFGATACGYVHVGVASNFKLRTQESSESHIYTYALNSQATDMDLMHCTPLGEGQQAIPRAMCDFQDRLVVGLGRAVRVYDLGKKKLLLKCVSKQVPHFVTTLASFEERLFVGDVQESVTFMKYRKETNTLSVFADDTEPRYVMSIACVDYASVACADKFGNLCVLKLPDDVNDDHDDDPSGTRSLWDRGWLGGASQKCECVACCHVGEIVTSLQRTSLTYGRSECILYTTIAGTVGALIPIELKDEFELFQTLEMHVRAQEQPLSGRDHLAFQSSYFPVKNIIDGDLCERFLALDARKQQKIADELERQPGEISLQIDQMIERII